MSRFLIDANLPYRFSIWRGEDFIHQFDLGDSWSDEKIWEYARDHHLTIVSKDADFSNRIIASGPPPKVIHLKIGNMKLSEMHAFISDIWDEIVSLNKSNKLVNVYEDRIYGIE